MRKGKPMNRHQAAVLSVAAHLVLRGALSGADVDELMITAARKNILKKLFKFSSALATAYEVPAITPTLARAKCTSDPLMAS
jgi:hypothetical protein